MKLNLQVEAERNKAETYFAKLLKDGAKIELRKINPVRSLNQNSYLHCLFILWGAEWGYSLDEAKKVVKELLGYTYIKNNVEFLCKTSKMPTDKLSEFINKFRNMSAGDGLYLPSADEYLLRHFEYSQEIDRAEQIQSRYT
jgi:hypothetical protein